MKLESRKQALQDLGLKISRTETEYRRVGGEGGQGTVKMGLDSIKIANTALSST